jgi:hypothetical protein
MGAPSPSAASAPTEEPATAEKKPKLSLKEQGTIPLEIQVKFSSLPPMTIEGKKAARERCGMVPEILNIRHSYLNTIDYGPSIG